MYTKLDLIAQAKTAEEGVLDCHLPMLTNHFGEFAGKIGLDHDEFYHIRKYIKNASYDAKRQVFEQLGFKVLYLTLGAHKVSMFARDEKSGKSLDQQFLDGERNVFIFDVEHSMENLYFILEYEDKADPLCNHTVDREKLARELERKAKMGSWFKSMRERRDETSDSDNPF